jgi:hypothetical protein
MNKGKRYTCRVVQDGSSWTAEITRRVTAKKRVASKKQGGFATESEARAWGEKELKAFINNLNERNMRHSELRKQNVDNSTIK